MKFEDAVEIQNECKRKRDVEAELLNATSEDGVVLAAEQYQEVVEGKTPAKSSKKEE